MRAGTAGGCLPGDRVIGSGTAAGVPGNMQVERTEGAKGGLQDVGGGEQGLPSSQAAAVKASLRESRETWPQGDHLTGDRKECKKSAAAAKVLPQAGQGPGGTGRMNTPEAGGEGTSPTEEEFYPVNDWLTVVKGKNKRLGNKEDDDRASNVNETGGIGRLARKLREEQTTESRKSNEIREGDWECMDQMCKWRNFSWRKYCMKCQKTPQGQKALGAQGASGGAPVIELARDRARRIGEMGETSRRHPKVLVLTINLLIENKTNMKPQLEDHYSIMKQVGLNLAEVRGKVGKTGYLEVALVPGAASAASSLREVSKIVNDKITILSVREQGSTREVLVRWQEVPFGTLDETLYSYLELFSKPVRPGRNLWWEVCKPEDDMSPEGEMVGKWTGERTLMVTLKPGVGHIPVWHYVGGARIRLQVPGRRSCARCLQAVGECKGGWNWDRCQKEKMPRSTWKDEQEKFLKSVGWNEEQQKIM